MLNNVSGILSDFLGDSNKPMAPSVTLEGTKGNNDIYTSDVTANISINRGLETTGTIKLHYSLSGAKTQEEQVIEEDVSIQITEEGTTTITAWTENDKGNLSEKVEITFTINKTAPSTPTIALSGTNGENGYYISNVGVTISAGETANVASIKYKVEDANPIAETESTGSNDVTFDITNDGTSTVTAYIINTAGLTSETITETVNKDSTAPNTATIALSGEAGRTTIDVTASGADVTSGVASYIFQISTTGNEDDFQSTDTVTNTANSCTYEYDELTADTTYYLRVIVKDKAGNTIASNIVNTKTKLPYLTVEELALKIGEYVDYKPVSGTFSDHVGETYSGDEGNNNVQLSTDTSLKWQILFADSNTLTLISEKPVHDDFYLRGANGYNNGVLLLNKACKGMYSNDSLGATGRSLKIEDIESVSSYSGATNQEYTPSSRYYPNIFAQEEGGNTSGSYGSLGRSEQSSYVTGYSQAGTLRGRYTYYSYSMSSSYMNQKYVTLFNCSPRSWLASRCVNYVGGISDYYFYFGMFYVSGGTVVADWLYHSSNSTGSNSCAVRPVVEIDLTKVNVGVTGTGADGDGYSLTLK